MNKEYNDSTWQGKAYSKILDTTQQVTSFPVVVRPMENTIPSWTIKGNMQQTGTPTPSSPITPSECGEKTGNLFYSSNNQTAGSTLHITQTIGNSKFILNKNESQTDTSANIDIDVTLPAGTYTLSVTGLNLYNNDYDRVFLRDDNSAIVVQNVQVNRPQSFTLSETKHIYRATVVAAAQSTYNNTTISIMLNTGSTILPYQPYGYKIPISSANTTTPVYLGEVETTRRIRELVLTGEETIALYTIATGNLFRIELPSLRLLAQFEGNGMCTHYRSVSRSADRINGTISGGNVAAVQGVVDIVDDYATVDDFKAYLAAQYAAGTPVTVWYVLATPTTGIVNEPLRKIGEYADTVSGTNLSVTAQSPTTIDVDTSLKPSEMDLTYTGLKMCKRKKRVNGAWV